MLLSSLVEHWRANHGDLHLIDQLGRGAQRWIHRLSFCASSGHCRGRLMLGRLSLGCSVLLLPRGETCDAARAAVARSIRHLTPDALMDKRWRLLLQMKLRLLLRLLLVWKEVMTKCK